MHYVRGGEGRHGGGGEWRRRRRDERAAHCRATPAESRGTISSSKSSLRGARAQNWRAPLHCKLGARAEGPRKTKSGAKMAEKWRKNGGKAAKSGAPRFELGEEGDEVRPVLPEFRPKAACGRERAQERRRLRWRRGAPARRDVRAGRPGGRALEAVEGAAGRLGGLGVDDGLDALGLQQVDSACGNRGAGWGELACGGQKPGPWRGVLSGGRRERAQAARAARSPLRNARRVNSPGSARAAPAACGLGGGRTTAGGRRQK